MKGTNSRANEILRIAADEESMPINQATQSAPKYNKPKNSTPKINKTPIANFKTRLALLKCPNMARSATNLETAIGSPAVANVRIKIYTG